MSSQTSEALLLSQHAYGDADVFYSFLTKDIGRITLKGGSAKRSYKRGFSQIDYFKHYQVVFAKRPHDDIGRLEDVQLVADFSAVAANLARFTHASECLGLFGRILPAGENSPEYFALLVFICRLFVEGVDAELVRALFEAKVCKLLGVPPTPVLCGNCSEPLIATRSVHFGTTGGEFFCQGCSRGERQIVALSGESMAVLRALVEQTPRNFLATTRFTDALLREVRDFLELYIRFITGVERRQRG